MSTAHNRFRCTSAAEDRRAEGARAGWAARPEDAVEVAAGRAAQARPAHAVAQPGHVHRRDRRRLEHDPGDRRPVLVRLADRGLAVADGALRQPGRGGRRGPRQGAGRVAAQDQDRHHGPSAHRLEPGRSRPRRRGRRAAAAAGRHRRRRGRPGHPRRRRRRGRHCVGGRVGDHRRVRAGDPRVRRRPVGGHRRHHGAVRPHRRARSRRSPARASSTG